MNRDNSPSPHQCFGPFLLFLSRLSEQHQIWLMVLSLCTSHLKGKRKQTIWEEHCRGHKYASIMTLAHICVCNTASFAFLFFCCFFFSVAHLVSVMKLFFQTASRERLLIFSNFSKTYFLGPAMRECFLHCPKSISLCSISDFSENYYNLKDDRSFHLTTAILFYSIFLVLEKASYLWSTCSCNY